MAAQGGPPFFSLRGGCVGSKVGLRSTLPPAHPTPPPLPVPHPAQTKFPRVINFDSPLNDSRQLEWGGQHPLQGVLPLCTVGRDQLPRSQKQTSSSLPPLSMFLTAVTAMPFGANQ